MSALAFAHAEAPAPGAMRGIAPGVHWLRMPLPFAHLHFLEHAGSLRRSVGADGVARFAPAKEEAWKSALTA